MRQVLLFSNPEGGYTAEVPSLPGCISQGETIDETLVNIREAIELWIEDAEAHGETIPEDTNHIVVAVV